MANPAVPVREQILILQAVGRPPFTLLVFSVGNQSHRHDSGIAGRAV